MREAGIRDADGRGAVDAHAVARDESRRRRRACRSGGRRARPRGRPRAREGTPWISQPSSVARTCPPIARSSSATVSRRLDSLTRSSPAPRTTVRPRAIVAASASSGSSSIRLGTISGSISVATSSAGCTSTSAIGSPPAVVRRLKRLMRAPMRSSTVSSPVRVGLVDMPRTNRRDSASSVAATRNGAAEEMSPGTSTLPSCEALDRPHRDGARPLGDARAGGAQQALGVIARRHRLDHGGRAGHGVEAGEQDARLDLRRGDRQLVADRLQLAAAVDVQRRAAVAVAEHGAHQPQRHRDAVDRAAADRLVAVERERAALADEQARAAGAGACPRCGRRSGPPGRCRPRSPQPCTRRRVVGLVEPLDARAQRLDRGQRGERVGVGPEAR